MKYLRVFFGCFMSMIILSGIEAKAELTYCSPGFDDSLSVTIYIGENQCPYRVKICYTCAVSTSSAGLIRVNSYAPLDPTNCDPEMSETEVLNAIYAQVYDDAFVQANMCNNMPPCDIYPNGIQYEMFWWNCWSKWTQPDPPYTVWRVPCHEPNQAYCWELWIFCWDGSQYKHTMLQQSQSGDVHCQENYEIPDDPDPGETAGCWQYHTPCDN